MFTIDFSATLSPVRRASLGVLAALTLAHGAFAQAGFQQKNLISADNTVTAVRIDPNLINPWGLAIGADFWIDSPGSGLSLVTDASGTASFNVAIPAANGTPKGSPTGTVFNSDSTAFTIPQMGSAKFIFATLDGTIAAWNTATTAITVANNSAAKAVYTGIVIDKNDKGTFLLAANQGTGSVDVFDTNFKQTALAGAFTDPQIPTNFHPFDVHVINGQVYVTYTQVDPATGKRVAGAGLGFVDIYDLEGNFVKQAIAQGVLNEPWGMAVAPATFGKFANDLLVGNFGDGVINVYDPTSFQMVGSIDDATGKPLVNTGLWEIVFGTGSGSTVAGKGDPNTLYLTAGINGTKGGVVAAVTPITPAGTGDFKVAETGSLTLMAGGTGSVSLSLTGDGTFNAPVNFSCTGLPAGDTCSFSPSTVTVSGTSATTVSLSVTAPAAAATTSTPTIPTSSPYSSPYIVSRLAGHTGVTLAFATPLTLLALAGMRRRRVLVKGTLLAASLLAVGFTLTGCGGGSSSSTPAPAPAPTPTPTPAPAPVTSQFMVVATSGTISHSVAVSITQ